MQFGVECAMANPFRSRQRFVDNRDCPFDIPGAGFGLGKPNLE